MMLYFLPLPSKAKAGELLPDLILYCLPNARILSVRYGGGVLNFSFKYRLGRSHSSRYSAKKCHVHRTAKIGIWCHNRGIMGSGASNKGPHAGPEVTQCYGFARNADAEIFSWRRI